MISVAEAEKIVLSQSRDFGTEIIELRNSVGRVLAETLYADRDFPPFDRVTMDGIAINFDAYLNGQHSFNISSIQGAGEIPINVNNGNVCIEIMTGASLPENFDTIIRYEDIEIKNNIANIVTDKINKGQNIHFKGADKTQGETIVNYGTIINSTVIGICASIGKTTVLVKKLPTVAIVSTGNELCDITETPTDIQIRQSNNHTIRAVLNQFGINSQMFHVSDNPEKIKVELGNCILGFDAVILSGGISAGKFDYIPSVLEELNVTKLFHKVNQRPGKPFWFGNKDNGAVVFGLPGNPVSTYMCLHRYFLPWLNSCMGIIISPVYAILNSDFVFKPTMQNFVQVKVDVSNKGELLATIISGNGSGDFSSLVNSNAFMELPADITNFTKGEIYKIWYYY